jgi:hypothetical protein
MSSSGLGIVEISGMGSSPTCMLSPGGPDACLLLGVIIGWLLGDPRSRSAQSSGSSADSKVSPGVAPIGGESVKSFKRSDEKPARTVCPRGSSAFGSAITNTSLLGNHAVVGTLDALEICILISTFARWLHLRDIPQLLCPTFPEPSIHPASYLPGLRCRRIQARQSWHHTT